MNWKKFFALNFIAVVLSILTMFLSGPLLRVLHRSYPQRYYWFFAFSILAVCFAIGLHPLSFLIFACFFIVGVYGELELRGRGGFTAAVVLSVLSSLIICGGFYWTFETAGIDLKEQMQTNLQNLFLSWKSTGIDSKYILGMDEEIVATRLFAMMPAFMALSMSFVLVVALTIDKRVAELTGFRWNKIASQMNLFEFRAPDYFIWIMMVSFLFSFLDMNWETGSLIARNIFILSLGVYLMQAIAVVESLFLYYRVGLLWRLIIYLLVVGQGVFLLIIAGIVDYWADFRRLARRKKAPKNTPNSK